MKKVIKLEGWIHCRPTDGFSMNAVDGFEYRFWTTDDMSCAGMAMVTPYTMEFEAPEQSLNSKFVEILETKKKEIQAEFQKRITEIQAEINKLTAITCDEVTQ
jgi:hypothetical protein